MLNVDIELGDADGERSSMDGSAVMICGRPSVRRYDVQQTPVYLEVVAARAGCCCESRGAGVYTSKHG